MRVETGIFWVIRGEIVFDRESREVGEGEDFVNYSKSHFDMWENLRQEKKLKAEGCGAISSLFLAADCFTM